MNKKVTWWQILVLLIGIAGTIFLVLSITTDINDGIFLPAAFCCVVAANALQLAFRIRNKKK